MDQNKTDKSRSPRRLRRNIIIVFACMLLFALIAVPLLSLLERRENPEEEEETKKQNSIIFVTPDYDLDIMKDEEYLGLNRYIMYADNNTGLNVMLDDQSLPSYNEGVRLLVKLINDVIRGDADAYNQLFSDLYYEENDPEAPFTMQQLYDIQLTLMETKHIEPKKGKNYTQYEFTVEYKIHKNNGTYRTDIGLDESRKQVFVISDREGKDMLIDAILYYRYG